MKNLVIILGPTGVGKTDLSLDVADAISAPIISADSRQLYRDLPICSAAATPRQRARVQHFFVGTNDLETPYSAAQFEADALRVIDGLPGRNVVMCGGSMMYIDAVCNGIDDMPQADPAIRARLKSQLAADGLALLLEQLRRLDPEYYAQVDRQNPQRVLHGVEMCLTTGRPFSSFRTGQRKQRPFRVLKIGITRPREELDERLALRVQQMLSDGLIDETRRVYDRYATSLHKQLADVVRNPGPTQAQAIPNLAPSVLNTVGLKEMLLHFEGIYSLEKALERIVHNSRTYSKKQLTWFRRDNSISWFEPHQSKEIMSLVDDFLCCRT
ncbi:MAG: tRNA (adenosine(37)-N6)-dimethylallyltransferase MiaA [Bacteroidales bacterium]|nr:tRNA (adenosine(37)-N6)-dimethylallyltransferase MiaA [Bacteroidales bacterium]